MHKRLIATDYDGTFRRDGIVSDYDCQLISEWQKKGNYFGIVTGRGENFLSVAPTLPVKVDYLILYNGAMILDRDFNVLQQQFIPRVDFRQIEEIHKKYDGVVDYDVATDEEWYLQYYSQCETPEIALEIADEINKTMGDRVSAFVNYWHVNVCVKGASKADGVRFMLDHYGLSVEECAAVGDDFNDIDMIVSLDGYAVSTARDEVKQKAPHIIDNVGDLTKI